MSMVLESTSIGSVGAAAGAWISFKNGERWAKVKNELTLAGAWDSESGAGALVPLDESADFLRNFTTSSSESTLSLDTRMRLP